LGDAGRVALFQVIKARPYARGEAVLNGERLRRTNACGSLAPDVIEILAPDESDTYSVKVVARAASCGSSTAARPVQRLKQAMAAG
jgi:hypothetical protein